MSIRLRLEEIADALGRLQAPDPAGLEALQVRFAEFAGLVESPELSALSEVATAAATVLEEIAREETDDAAASLVLLRESVRHAQDILRSVLPGTLSPESTSDLDVAPTTEEETCEPPGATTESADEVVASEQLIDESDELDSLVDDDAEGAEPPELVVFPPEVVENEELHEHLAEARHNVECAEEALLHLEKEERAAELLETVLHAFRAITDMAQSAQLAPIADVACVATTLFEPICDGEADLSDSLLDLLLQSCDMLSRLLDTLDGHAAPTRRQHEAHLQRLRDAAAGPIADDAGLSLEQAPDPTFHPLGGILVDLGMVTPDAVEAALARQRDGAHRLCSLLMSAGLTEADTVEEALVEGDETGQRIRNRLIAMQLVDAGTLDEAILARRESGKRLGELLGLKPTVLASALRQQRLVRRGEAHPGTAAGRSEFDAAAKDADQRPRNVARDPAVVLRELMAVLEFVHDSLVEQTGTTEANSSQDRANTVARIGTLIADLRDAADALNP